MAREDEGHGGDPRVCDVRERVLSIDMHRERYEEKSDWKNLKLFAGNLLRSNGGRPHNMLRKRVGTVGRYKYLLLPDHVGEGIIRLGQPRRMSSDSEGGM